MTLGEDLWAEIYAHCRAAYPHEACGLLLAPEGSDQLSYRRCKNLQTDDPILDPKGHERSAETAFHLDSRELLRAEREGLALQAIVHSHPDHDAYFSAMDREGATYRFEGEAPEPMFPGTVYLVVSVRQRSIADARWYCWSDAEAGFVEAKLSELG